MSATPTRLRLEDYGLIGNLHTAALVSRSGSIDWTCLPRFSSPSVFARVLDPDRGGYLSVAPRERYRSRQLYRPNSGILVTEFALSRRRTLRVEDLMPIESGEGSEPSPTILRRVSVSGGSTPVEVIFAPRFDYGRASLELDRETEGVRARAGRDELHLSLAGPVAIDDGTARAERRVSPGRPLEIELTWGRRRGTRETFRRRFDRTDRYWKEWVHLDDAPFHRATRADRPYVVRSEITLKLLSPADTGAFVAAPTTSFPEWPGGTRNWDYRFVWIRDAAFTGETLFRLGHPAEALGFLRWALLRVREAPSHRLRVVYGAHGEEDLTEKELPHLRGMWNSRPVRIGNGAAEQFQLDIYGELLDAALLLRRYDPQFLARHWSEIAELADVAVALWREPDRGIWEVRGPPQHYVHSKLMAWVALDRAARLGALLDEHPRPARWAEEAERLRSWLLTRGYDEERRSFRQAEGSSETDASNLRIPLVGFLPFDDPRVQGTLDRIQRELSRGPFVYRYRAGDGLPGEEGAFLAVSFWMVECLARSGREAEARRAWRQLLRSGTPLGLFSEEYDPLSHRRLGNFPQALTHIALLRAASALAEDASPHR